MSGLTIACVQHRMSISASREEFESGARRFLRQAQARAAQITVFPELSGLMLAPPLMSGVKVGFIKRADQAKRPTAGFLKRGVGGVSEAAASALGGGFRGGLSRLVRKKSDVFRDLYVGVFSDLAREFGTAIVAGSLYLYDDEAEAVRARTYLFDADGSVLGFQDKLNLAPDEQGLSSPGDGVKVFQTRFGRFGVLIGRDVLYPELARLIAIQGADLILGIAASPGAAQANIVRSALALRAEENQLYTAACFMVGPNYLGQENREEYLGQSAVMAPISLTTRGDGVLAQVGSSRAESLLAVELDIDALHTLQDTGRFCPRREMNLGALGPVLGEMYSQGLTIEGAIEQRLAGPVAPEPEPFESVPLYEPEEEMVVPPEPSGPESLSLDSSSPEEAQD